MEAQISNFRLGRHTKSDNHMVLLVPGVDSREKAESLKEKKVVWKSPSGKEIRGVVAAPHGNSGAIRVIFEKGMPGQAIGSKVEIN
jgi:large subunit ribosomal protein L35Ae